MANYTLTANDISAGSATATVSGTSIATQGDGNVSVKAQIIDKAGNPSVISAETVVVVDTTAPAISINTPIMQDNRINASEATAVTVSGSTDAPNGQTVTVTFSDGINPNVTATATVSGGAWSIAATDISSLDEGNITVSTSVSDLAGNIGNTGSGSGNITITLDVTPPPNPPVINTITSDNVISASEIASGVTLTGSNESGNSVTFTIAGQTRVASVNGTNWSYTLTAQDFSNMGEGAETISAVQTDAAGNVSTAATHDFSIDTQAGISITTPIMIDDIINDSEDNAVTVSGSVSGVEDGRIVTVTLHNPNNPALTVTQTGIVTSGLWSITADIGNLDGGSISVTASVSDQAGNSASSNTSVTLDADAPTVTTYKPVDDGKHLITANLELTFNEAIHKGSGNIRIVNDSDNITTTIAITSGQVSIVGNKLIIDPSSDLISGKSYHVEIDSGALLDDVGNAYTGISNSTTWNFVASDLAVALNSVGGDGYVNAAENSGSLAISGTVSSSSTGIISALQTGDFTVTLVPQGGGTTVYVTVSSYIAAGVTGTWSGIITAGTLVNGTTYDVSVSVLGHNGVATGLTANTSGTATVDTTAPTAGIMVLASYDDNGISSNDYISNDNNFNLSISGNEVGSTVSYEYSADNSSWSATTVGQLGVTNGTHYYRAKVTDAAGNTSYTASLAVQVDTSAPTAGTLSLTGFTDNGFYSNDFVSNDNTYTLSLTGYTPGATLIYERSSDGGASWSTTDASQSSVADGSYQYRVIASDTAGNTSISNVVSVTVDTLAPMVRRDGTGYLDSVLLEATGVTNGSDDSPQITAVGSAGEYVVSWSGVDTNGDTSIFVQQFNADGSVSGSAVKLEATGVTNGADQTPQITAVGSAGEYVVSWSGVDTNGERTSGFLSI